VPLTSSQIDADLDAIFADAPDVVVFMEQSTRGFFDQSDGQRGGPYREVERAGRTTSVLCQTGALTGISLEQSTAIQANGVSYRVVDLQLEDDGKTTRYFLQPTT
jgi:hypothetical protein